MDGVFTPARGWRRTRALLLSEQEEYTSFDWSEFYCAVTLVVDLTGFEPGT